MHKIINHFVTELGNAKQGNRSEPQIVKQFVESVKTSKPLQVTGGKVTIDSRFIHQKPYAYLISPSNLYKVKRTELGDLLFVIKNKKGNQITKKRCAIFQIKLTSSDVIKLTPHQHDFQRFFYNIAFTFGKSFFNEAKLEQIVWSHVTRSTWFISNLFLYPNCDCVSCAKDINPYLSPTFSLKSNPCSINKGMYFKDFLYYFFSYSHVGVPIMGQVKGIIEIIYKALKWREDPEEEWLEYFGNNPGNDSENEGFGIIECTFEFDHPSDYKIPPMSD